MVGFSPSTEIATTRAGRSSRGGSVVVEGRGVRDAGEVIDGDGAGDRCVGKGAAHPAEPASTIAATDAAIVRRRFTNRQ